MAWGVDYLRGKSLRSLVCRLVMWLAIYHIWQQRNAILHNEMINSLIGKHYESNQMGC
jgi:hypothetical protein